MVAHLVVVFVVAILAVPVCCMWWLLHQHAAWSRRYWAVIRADLDDLREELSLNRGERE